MQSGNKKNFKKWLTEVIYISTTGPLSSLACACGKTAPYTVPLEGILVGQSFHFHGLLDSNDFIKPLILARSAWLQHRWVALLISNSISREPCTAVAADTYMPSTLKYAGNLFPPLCSSSGCISPSDKTPYLWYLATKRRGDVRGGSYHFVNVC